MLRFSAPISSHGPARLAQALLIGSFAIASGCSFLLDFPKEGGGSGGSTTSASSTDASSVSGSAAGGTGGKMACFGSTEAPSVDQLTWQGAPVGASAADVVRTTGLFRAKSTNLLYAFGSTTNGLTKPSSPAGTLFLVKVQDDGMASLVQSGRQCGGTLHPLARRLTALADDSSMLFASSLSIDTASSSWGFDGLGQTGCGTGGVVTLHTPTALQSAQVPFMGGAAPDPLDYTDGVALDLDYAFPRRVLFGVGGGDTDNGYFLRVKDETVGGPGVTTWLSDLVFINGGFRESWTGGVALDASGKAWFAADSCDLAAGCTESKLFFGRFGPGDPAPSLLVKLPSAISSGTSVRVLDGLVLVGGHYQDTLQFSTQTFPQAASTDPFVVAVDATTSAVVWAYPTTTPSGAPGRFTSVVDMAVSGTRDCGAVYVTGCSAPLTATRLDCATGEPGKTGFVTKLDSKTGKVIWTREITLAAPASDFFIPTALAADSDHVWLAATFSGTLDAWGQPIKWGGAQDSVIVRLPP